MNIRRELINDEAVKVIFARLGYVPNRMTLNFRELEAAEMSLTAFTLPARLAEELANIKAELMFEVQNETVASEAKPKYATAVARKLELNRALAGIPEVPGLKAQLTRIDARIQAEVATATLEGEDKPKYASAAQRKEAAVVALEDNEAARAIVSRLRIIEASLEKAIAAETIEGEEKPKYTSDAQRKAALTTTLKTSKVAMRILEEMSKAEATKSKLEERVARLKHDEAILKAELQALSMQAKIINSLSLEGNTEVRTGSE